jgi:uncharacterized protein YqhQ
LLLFEAFFLLLSFGTKLICFSDNEEEAEEEEEEKEKEKEKIDDLAKDIEKININK